ncbi:LacI family DNA-binding transcriptional regulator [Pseudonocardia sp. CA-107938]|uniref:LacI family DNA-binding transcriptional regulator n=1 Tax=Pseudonocardia sp. CA-107938 TaxID=3240021 RepID=UPI003D9053A5
MGDRRRRTTLRDVATEAGVSVKTVSRVVNGEAGVAPAVRAHVAAVVEQLGYRPDVGARTLRRNDRRSASIALLLEDLANPYSAALLRAVEDVARPRGVVVLAASLDEDPVRERALARAFGSRSVDGLVLAPAGDDQSHLVEEITGGTAVVCVDRAPAGIDVDTVVSTDAAGVADGVRHLADHGHTRIAFLGDLATIATARLRHDGYRAGLAGAGLPYDPRLVVRGVRSDEAVQEALTALLALPDPPTALLGAQNLITAGLVRALRRLDLHHRIALVGYDDFLFADLLSPAVTVVAQDPATIGRTAADLLFDRIGGAREAPRTVEVPTRLIVRGSGELPPDR